jgi:uracil-DNA glycosylase family 4
VLVGLAPGPDGANRTGLPFHGDPSSAFLTDAMAAEGLLLDGAPHGVWVTNAVRCLPPGNKPTTTEVKACAARWLAPELARARVVLALGRVAHDAVLRLHGRVLARHRFAHGAQHALEGQLLVDSLHPSPLNTRTGRLDAGSMRRVLRLARSRATSDPLV